MCKFQDDCHFLTIITDICKNIFKLLLLVQHKFLSSFNYKLLRKNGEYQ